jgi:hydroxymethylglutaryl-CoA synthase
MTRGRVGLEAIALDIPNRFVDLGELAEARGVDPAKFMKGLGQREMAVASASEDTVVFAVGAGARLIHQFQLDPSSIGLLIIGTETGIDQSKAASSYVHEHLGLSSSCRSFETKHACYGAMAALQMATDWVLSGRAAGKKALVIASDIARYGANTPGEPTQGAGAVALLISSEPKLLEFETGRQGFYAEQVMDFWRPNYSKEAFVDGHYSIECYTNALIRSYDMYVAKEPAFLNTLDACLYHAPFAKMAQKAHIALSSHLAGSAAFAPDTAEYKLALADYTRRVLPYLEIQSRVGNTYTASLFMALRGLLEDGVFIGQKRAISLFSYGSGCAAEFMTARVMEENRSILKKNPYRAQLDSRKKISVSEYEEILELSARMDLNDSHLSDSAASRLLAEERIIEFRGVKDHQRQYVSSRPL